VNSIVHPLVFNYFREWVARQDTPYTIMEAAILFESGACEMMDKIVTVVTPMKERIERLVRGNKLTKEQITDRIRNQIDDESRIKKSDYVIFNSENDMIIPAVLEIHKEMLKLYNKSK
jgi:dephospho-CoA kinase